MTARKINKIQSPMLFETSFDIADLGNSIEIDVPPGFVLLKATVAVRTAFDGPTPTIGVVDNKSSPTTIIAATTDLTAAAETESAAGPNYTTYPSGGVITAALAGGAGATVGAGAFIVQGYIEGRQTERYGT